jgi:deferrochelatase/peroxidase EfeB
VHCICGCHLPCLPYISIVGAPVDRDPTQDNPVDAGDVNKINNFDYSDDPNQIRCPFASHLRKTNPRNSQVPGLDRVLDKRIIRQGIPYGPEVTQAESSSATTQFDRGLLFVRETDPCNFADY